MSMVQAGRARRERDAGRISILILGAVGASLLTGCGMGSGAPSASSLPAVAGVVHGGPNPISGATVVLYATQPTGTAYGSAGLELARSTTDSKGNFTLPASVCPAGQQAYMVSKGGNPGGPVGRTNPNYLLMAAVGDCANVTADTYIEINELSTVAAAYALANFISIAPTGDIDGSYLVKVGAPAAANPAPVSPSLVAEGGCVTLNTVASSYISSCVTAGLRHAFMNARNLVEDVGTVAGPALGRAYTVPPSNPLGEVPQAEINTLGNIVLSCVNSTGGVASDTTTTCGTLFHATTPAGGSAPTNTLQAMINLVKNPLANVGTLFGLQTAQNTYLPSLVSAPDDFSLAIVFNGLVSGSTAVPFVEPFVLVLDANDNVYTLAESSNFRQTGMAGLTANGTANLAPSFESNHSEVTNLAADTEGNIWASHNDVICVTTCTPDYGLLRYSATVSGPATEVAGEQSQTDLFYGVAIDRSNNVWVGVDDETVGPTLRELVRTSSYTQATFATPPVFEVGMQGVAIDAFQNVWTTNVPQGSGFEMSSIGFFPNTGTATAPTYTHAAISQSVTGNLSFSNISIDGDGNAITGAPLNSDEISDANLYIATPASATSPSTTFTVGAALTSGSTFPAYNAVDGAGAIWITDEDGDDNQPYSALVKFTRGSSDPLRLQPCRAAAGATNCGDVTAVYPSTTARTLLDPEGLQVDSAGDVWVASLSSGLIVEVLGVAAPTWPLLAYGHPGVEPQ